MKAASQGLKMGKTAFHLEHRCRVAFFSSIKKYWVNFSPDLEEGCKIVIPVSMGRYNLSDKKRKEYDDLINILLKHTAHLLRLGFLSRVDVLSTADLQRINWDDRLTDEIEQHFFDTHKDLLAQQSKKYKWREWIEEKGRDTFEENYKLITKKSMEGTEWHDLMVNTHHSVSISSSLEKSLEYQRREYAAVMLMKAYDRLIYSGPISLAWSYMYHQFAEGELPIFTKAIFDNYYKDKSVISVADAGHSIRILLANIEQTLTSPNFPKAEKEKLISGGMSLFYAYKPRLRKKQDQKPVLDKEKDIYDPKMS